MEVKSINLCPCTSSIHYFSKLRIGLEVSGLMNAEPCSPVSGVVPVIFLLRVKALGMHLKCNLLLAFSVFLVKQYFFETKIFPSKC